jgi:SAM-dependent methyltransferase
MAGSAWIEFWDSDHPLFVDARHRAAHFRNLAQDIRRYAPAGGRGEMLDYGCGEALSADEVAQALARLILCEPAPNVRAALAARFSANPKIAVCKPEDIAAMQAASLDVIVMHSVSQYLSPSDLDDLLRSFRRLLRPGGLLVLGDVIPTHTSALTDAVALLTFGAREGFFLKAVMSLIRTRFSGYWRLRQSLGLTRHQDGEIMAKLSAAGFSAERASSNIGHNARRMTFLARAR